MEILLLVAVAILTFCLGYRTRKILEDKRAAEVNAVDDLRGTIEQSPEEGGFVKDDRDMLGSILDLSQVEVGDIMVHRRDMTSLNISDAPAIVINAAIESEHTRIPIWQDDPENIIGIFHTKDVLKINREEVTREQLKGLLKEAIFIPETTSLKDQMENFRKTRSHIGMVVDEYGSLMGLVTLEDILEEIVGQIDDEHDKVIRGIKQQKDGSYIVRGNLNIRDLNREMDWSLPIDDYANTIAGMVIKLAENIPEIGDKFTFNEYEFTVVGKIRNQITSIRIDMAAVETDEQE